MIFSTKTKTFVEEVVDYERLLEAAKTLNAEATTVLIRLPFNQQVLWNARKQDYV